MPDASTSVAIRTLTHKVLIFHGGIIGFENKSKASS